MQSLFASTPFLWKNKLRGRKLKQQASPYAAMLTSPADLLMVIRASHECGPVSIRWRVPDLRVVIGAESVEYKSGA